MFSNYDYKKVWILIFAAVFALTMLTGNTFADPGRVVLPQQNGPEENETFFFADDLVEIKLEMKDDKIKDNNGKALGKEKQEEEIPDEAVEEELPELPEEEELPEEDLPDNPGQGQGSGGNGQGQDEPEDDPEEEPELSSDSSLSMIFIGDKALPGFSPEKTEYTYLLPKDTVVLPEITAVPNDENASVKFGNIVELPGTLVIQVAAQDGSETHYKLNLSVKGLPEGETIILQDELIPLGTLQIFGIWLPPVEDNFVLEKKSTKIRFWVSEQLLYPEIWIFEVDEGYEDIMSQSLVIKIGTSELKSSTGNGKHSKSVAENGEGGYYKYNLKGKNFPQLEMDKQYALAIMNEGCVVTFGIDQPAILHFTMGEVTNTVIKERNKTYNESTRRSNVGSKQD
ncbi:MAG: hypothetical protein JXQ26_10835 [Tissierellales bacterium]|nr:hypothetical protein [Tissierellales bacterium]MBN2828480.1 hypothetical protein [Tissierellales bacterium]